MNSTCIVLVALLIGNVMAQTPSAADLAKVRECAEETNTKPDMGVMVRGMPDEVDDSRACFIRCIGRKFNMLKKNNSLNVETVKKYARQDANVDEVVKSCTSRNKQKGECIKAAHVLHCVAKGALPDFRTRTRA